MKQPSGALLTCPPVRRTIPLNAPATPPPSNGELPDTHPGDDAGGQFEEHPLTGEWSASPATFLEVLAEAPPGATIELGAGVYRIPATVNFRRHAFLIGAGSTRTRLESTGPGPVLRLAESAALALRDLTIAVVNDAPGNVIEATDGALIMERVRVTGARGRRNTSTPDTPDDASPEPGYGLVVGGAVWATITSCQFDGNEAGGICVRDACAPTIVDIQTEGGTAGVVFSGQSAGALTRSRCIGAAIGILVLDRARPVLDANTCARTPILASPTGFSLPVSRVPTTVRTMGLPGSGSVMRPPQHSRATSVGATARRASCTDGHPVASPSGTVAPAGPLPASG